MSKPWKELRDESYERDPGRVARVDQLRAAMEEQYNRWYWRLVRWFDKREGAAFKFYLLLLRSPIRSRRLEQLARRPLNKKWRKP